MHESYFQNINNVEKRTSSLNEPWNWRLWSNRILYYKGEAGASGLKCAKATPTHHLAGMLRGALKGNSHRGEQENTAASRHERREGTATTLRGHFYPLPLEERAALFWAHTCACANKRKKTYTVSHCILFQRAYVCSNSTVWSVVDGWKKLLEHELINNWLH